MKKARVRKQGQYWRVEIPTAFSWTLDQAFQTWREAYDWVCSYLYALENDLPTHAPEGY